MFRIVLIASTLCLGSLAWGQEPVGERQSAKPSTRTVSNADVLAMERAQLPDDVIVSSIEHAQSVTFDLTPASLIALKEAGLSDSVLKVMQSRQARASGSPPDGVASGPTVTLQPCKIFFTEEDPPSRYYVVLRKEVQEGKKFYGGHDDDLMYKLARKADKVGADAIIKFHEWRAPSMWSWAAAKSGGMAVKWTDEGKAAVPSMKGQCWSPTGSEN